MKKMWVLALLIPLVLMMCVTVKASEPDVTLYIGNTCVVSNGVPQDVSISGATYDASTKSLTLSGVSISDSHVYTGTSSAGIYAEGDLTIILDGVNAIGTETEKPTHGIRVVDGTLTIQGTGSLTVYGSNNGIVTGRSEGHLDPANLIIKSGNVTANGGKSGIRSEDTLFLEGGMVNAISGKNAALLSYGGIVEISGGTITAKGSGSGIGGATVILLGGDLTLSVSQAPYSGKIIYCKTDAIFQAVNSAITTYNNNVASGKIDSTVVHMNNGAFAENEDLPKDAVVSLLKDKYNFGGYYFTSTFEENSSITKGDNNRYPVHTVDSGSGAGQVYGTYYAKWTYDVTFDGNGATEGATAKQTLTDGDTTTPLTENGFTKTGYTFKEWNTEADGSGTSYTDKSTTKPAGCTTLYAQWTPNNYTVTFNANGGSGTMPGETATHDVPYTLPACAFTAPAGKTFVGWATAANGAVIEGTTAKITADTELFAIWTLKVDAPEAFTEGSAPTDGATVTIGAGAEGFEPGDVDKVTVNGNEVDAKNYEVSVGSLNITFQKAYLDTLGDGTYPVAITLKGRYAGTYTSTLTVNAAPSAGGGYVPPADTVTSPKTFDAGVAFYGVMALASACGAVYVTKKRH